MELARLALALTSRRPPRCRLKSLAAASSELAITTDADPCAEAADNWLLLVTAGTVQLTRNLDDEGGSPSTKRAARGALMGRFELEAGNSE